MRGVRGLDASLVFVFLPHSFTPYPAQQYLLIYNKNEYTRKERYHHVVCVIVVLFRFIFHNLLLPGSTVKMASNLPYNEESTEMSLWYSFQPKVPVLTIPKK
jgi:hypothetical protein